MTVNETEGFVDKYNSMYTEAIRLKSFQGWPFGENSNCSATKMAEAGFFHCPTKHEQDLVQCYVCFKELDGWEATDEPWSEHLSHSKMCVFAQFGKPQKDLTIEEVFKIEQERKVNKNRRITGQKIQNFRKMAKAIEDFILDMNEKVQLSRKKK